MKLHDLHNNPGARKRRKTVGRGDGSGHGGTSGKGHKGQRARAGANMRPFFEGGQIPFFRRLPKHGFSHPRRELNIVNISVLDKIFSANDSIDEKILQEKGIIGDRNTGLKVLGNGEVTKALKIKANKFSASAKAKIEAAGGTCEQA